MRLTLAFALLIGISAAVEADTLDAIKHPYQLIAVATTCDPNFGGACDIEFPATTATRTLVTHVSCEFTLPLGGYASSTFSTHQGLNKFNALQVFDAGPNVFESGFENFGINTDVYLFIDKGVVPAVDVTSNLPVQFLACTISGFYLE